MKLFPEKKMGKSREVPQRLLKYSKTYLTSKAPPAPGLDRVNRSYSIVRNHLESCIDTT